MAISDQDAKRWCYEIAKAASGQEVALIVNRTDDKAFYTLYADQAGLAHSSVVNMIELANDRGIREKHNLQPRKLYTSLKGPSKMDAAMAEQNNIKLVSVSGKDAKRGRPLDALLATELKLTDLTSAGPFALPTLGSPSVVPGLGGEAPEVDRLYMKLAYWLIDHAVGADPVGAVLVSKTGEIIGWAVNKKSLNSIFHAEVNLMQHYVGGNEKLPEAILYTTLKPCMMCAGMIEERGAGRLRVIYAQPDFGKDANNTLLDKTDRLWQLGARGGLKVQTVGGVDVVDQLVQHVGATKSQKGTSGIVSQLALPQGKDMIVAAGQKLGDLLGDPPTDSDQVTRVLLHIGRFLHSLA